MCPSLNSRTDHTSLSLSQATQQRYALLPTTEQTITLYHYPELHNRDIPTLLPTAEQTTPLCHYLKLHKRYALLSTAEQTTPLCHYLKLHKRYALLSTAEQTIPLCHYLKLHNRDVPFSQQQNKPHLSVIISSCDLQVGGANGLLLQNFSLWVVGRLEVGGVIQINGDVDQGNIEFWIHWVVVQSPHGQLPKNTTHTT